MSGQNRTATAMNMNLSRFLPINRNTMKKDYKNWSSSELKYLLEAREARIPYREIARDLGRTASACTHRFLQYKKNQIDLSEPEPAQEQPTETSVPILSIAIFLISIANAVALYLIMSGKL